MPEDQEALKQRVQWAVGLTVGVLTIFQVLPLVAETAVRWMPWATEDQVERMVAEEVTEVEAEVTEVEEALRGELETLQDTASRASAVGDSTLRELRDVRGDVRMLHRAVCATMENIDRYRQACPD